MAIAKSTPLLALLDQRWNETIKHIPDPSDVRPTPRPVYDANGKRLADMAARSHAQANHADPFAYGRARHYMRQGYWLQSDVAHDAAGITASRRNQGISFPIAKQAA